MRTELQLKILLCRKDLLDELDLDDVIEVLYQDQVVTEDERERVTTEQTTQDKIKRLLGIINRKEDACFDSFVSAIEKSNPDLANKLKSTEISPEQLKKNGEVRQVRGELDEILNRLQLEEDPDGTTYLSEIETAVKDEYRNHGQLYRDEIVSSVIGLLSVVCDRFPNTRLDVQSPRGKQKSFKCGHEHRIKGLWLRRDEIEKEDDTEQNVTGPTVVRQRRITGQEMSLRQLIQKQLCFLEEELDMFYLKDRFIEAEVFSDAEITSIPASDTRRRRSHQLLLMLSKKDEDALKAFLHVLLDANEDYVIQHLLEESKKTDRSHQSLESWNVEELLIWLKNVVEKNKIDPTIVQTFREEKISGKAFCHLTSDELKELVPSLKFGERKVVLVDRDRFLQEEDAGGGDLDDSSDFGTSYEMFRHFGRAAKSTDKYRLGSLMPEVEGRVSDMIQPVHSFIAFEEETTGRNLYEKIALETVTFAAACMNERTNGTVHFGISGSRTEKYRHGEVIGITVQREDVSSTIDKAVSKMFYPDQENKALACIRPAQFMQVVASKPGMASADLYVIEVDVIPSANIVENDVFRVKIKGDESFLLRLVENRPRVQDLRDFKEYLDTKAKLTERRLEMEKQTSCHNPMRDVRRELQDFLCSGGEKMDCDLYPLIFLSPPDDSFSKDSAKDQLSFLKTLNSRSVFDFDSRGTEAAVFQGQKELEQVFLVKKTDDFDKEKIDKKVMDECLKNIETSPLRPWVFCNGFNVPIQENLGPRKWVEEKEEIFQQILTFFKDLIPPERARIIIVLLSKKLDILAEAMRHVAVKFKNQWIVLAENEGIADAWKELLLRKHATIFDKESLDKRCCIGMQWTLLQETVLQFSNAAPRGKCQIPTSSGGFKGIPAHVCKQLCDLEVLSRDECTNVRKSMKDDDEEHHRRIEGDFYQGYQVSWWNFWYTDHVLERSQHETLKRQVSNALQGIFPDAGPVDRVAIYHQPGSGGTTTSRHILWDMKSLYPCCVVKRITKNTVAQVQRLRSFNGDSDPKPVLVLVDNAEEEELANFLTELEHEASNENSRVFCVLLICFRRTVLPFEKYEKRIVLRQELDAKEKEWFGRKYKAMLRKFKQKKCRNPKELISLNIMKDNFNRESIKRTVQEFLGKLKGREPLLLKYISFLNTYDLDFQAVPVASLDPIMTRHDFRFRTIVGKQWEQKLSQEIRVLLNQISYQGGLIKAFRIINPLLSEEIFNNLLETDSETLGELAVEFFNSNIFAIRRQSNDILEKIVLTILKRRAWTAGEEAKLVSFSPLIQALVDKGDNDEAVEVLKAGFKYSQDPMVGQVLARLYIALKNWDAASSTIATSKAMAPENSYLWHTDGHMFRIQLAEIYSSRYTRGKEQFDQETVLTAIKLAGEAFQRFCYVQVLNEKGKSKSRNIHGYTGQIEVVSLLLGTLSLATYFNPLDKLHQYLVDQNFFPPDLKFIPETSKIFLKSLHSTVFQVLDALERELMETKDPLIEQKSILAFKRSNKIVTYKEELNEYFGESLDSPPPDLNKDQLCEFRRRRVRKLGGSTFASIMRLKSQESGEECLKKILDHMHRNIQSSSAQPRDFMLALSAVLCLECTQAPCQTRIPFQTLLDWSRMLFNKRTADITAESCFLLLLLHWPTRQKSNFNICPMSLLKQAMDECDAKKEQYRSVSRSFKAEFFLTTYPEITSVLHSKFITESRQKKTRFNFRSPLARGRLLRLRGELGRNGQEISICIESVQGTRGPTLIIPLQMPLKSRPELWNCSVYCILGFGLKGVMAYDISEDNVSSERAYPMPQGRGKLRPRQNLGPAEKHFTFQCKINEYMQIFRKISMLKNRMPPYTREEMVLLTNEQKIWVDYNNLQRARDMFLNGYY